MAHPYGSISTVFDDIPKLDQERDKDYAVRKMEEADDYIDNLLPTPTVTVPLTTVPDVISLASQKWTKGLIYLDWGEKERGNMLIESAKQDVEDYKKTLRMNSPDRTGLVTIIDDTYKNFSNSPLVDDYFD